MAGNTIGQLFKFTSFGESHGKAIGGVIDGCPAGIKLDFEKINIDVERRKTNSGVFSSERNEIDNVEFISGIFEGKTTGTPISFLIWNSDAKPQDYSKIKDVYRPSHADFTYDKKYGIRDFRGGGRASARETVSRVVAGAIAKQVLAINGISINAFVSQIGNVKMEFDSNSIEIEEIEKSPIRCPEKETTDKMLNYLEKIKAEGDTVGGVISCIIKNVPAGLGEPVFDKLHADLAKAMLSINAVKGFEYGKGFESVSMKGSEYNDIFVVKDDKIKTKTNNSGGILGGISNGEDIYFNVAFKPVSSIKKAQKTVTKDKQNTEIEIGGRHDVCVVPRAVPIVEAMAAIILVDHYLRQKAIIT